MIIKVRRLTPAFKADKESRQVCHPLLRHITTNTTRSMATQRLTMPQEATATVMRSAQTVTTVHLDWEPLNIILRVLRTPRLLTAIKCPLITADIMPVQMDIITPMAITGLCSSSQKT